MYKGKLLRKCYSHTKEQYRILSDLYFIFIKKKFPTFSNEIMPKQQD